MLFVNWHPTVGAILLTVALSCVVIPLPVAAQKLVVFVGPQETGGEEVNRLLAHFAKYGSGGLFGWHWPAVPIDSPRSEAFKELVKDQDDEETQTALISAINETWSRAERGVVIGATNLARVGVNPHSGYQPIRAIQRVVDSLGVPPEDVKIVINYRTPRIDQWADSWRTHFIEEKYVNFICSNTQSDKRWEWIDTVLNPFKVAKLYRDKGWEVRVIDIEGTTRAGGDVAHALVCHAMDGVVCDQNGYVDGLQNETVEDLSSNNITELTPTQQENLEQLFLQRDCFYRFELDGQERFEVINRDQTWSDCDNERMNDYASLVDTDFFFNAIQYQKGCNTEDVNMPDFLTDDLPTDDPPTDDNESTLEPTDIPEPDDTPEPTAGDTDDSSEGGSVSSGKKLIVFVGPHETNGDEVLQFLERHASTNTSGTNTLRGWAWPAIQSDLLSGVASHHIFTPLVNKADDPETQRVIIDGIVDAWNDAEYGVVIGSLGFDKVGLNPDTDYDGVGAVRRVADALELSGSDVVVIATYRLPRIDNWRDVWDNHFEADLYEDFICDVDQADKRWEWLDTVMNPFMVAKKYNDEGWDVAVIDEQGTVNAGKDVSHVIACKFMAGIVCEDDWVTGLEDDRVDPLTSVVIETLDEAQRQNLEDLFLARDCYYKYELQDQSGFQIVNQQATWSSCSSQHKTFYKQFDDTDFLLNAIQSQVDCESNDFDVPSALENKLVDQNNKLVVFAGPHETGATSILKFFVDHVSTYEVANRSASFSAWEWPTVVSELLDETPPLIYEMLVSAEDERPVQNILMDGIRDSWNAAETGVIIGASNFDRIGKNPYSDDDGLGVLQRLVQELEIPSEDVTVVLNYLSPRIDHWGAVWSNHFREDQYADFICSDTQTNKRWEWLDTTMNPLRVANAYLEQGYNVVVIDDEGAWNAGMDVAHVISCEVMDGVPCQGGWVDGLEGERVERPETQRIDELSEVERNDLEQLFQLRDCYYQLDAESNSRFRSLYKNGLWKYCSEKNRKKYERLADTDFFLNALRELEDCSTEDVDLSSFLSEDFGSSDSDGVSGVLIAVIASLASALLIALCVMYRKCWKTRKSVKSPSDGVFRAAATRTPPIGFVGDDREGATTTNQRYSDGDGTTTGTTGPYSDNILGGYKNKSYTDEVMQNDTMETETSQDDDMEDQVIEEPSICVSDDDGGFVKKPSAVMS